MESYVYQAILTPEEDGGYSVDFPALPGCFTCGDDYVDALHMAADAARTYVASKLKNGEDVPPATDEPCPDGCRSAFVYFETSAEYIVDGEVVSAAEAARRLDVSRARVTQMLDAGILEGYRRGRRTYVTVNSIEARMAAQPKAGRPKKEAEFTAEMDKRYEEMLAGDYVKRELIEA